ncbi:Glycosyltransferase involved in cell wall bisynthesis [Pedobacter sp. ok626]|uniref:glycosyltransferase n=1 Tax=Pedobacter sp. ok626 TaxID=1761882 RepID=UPI00089087B3|nr:glycosyltransferase [Pedobacter sp. ok626]SDJ56391.1 Glycosyltransferase involved in cell wall bisynthesis [Pedobacter sp. ok626]
MNLEKIKPLGNVAIISSCSEDWGGSEELWGRSVPLLLAEGYSVTVYKAKINRNHPEFLKLASLGVTFVEIDTHVPFLKRNFKRIIGKLEQLRGNGSAFTFVNNPWVNRLTVLLAKNKHVFALVSQGINFDGLGYAYACNSVGLPYVLVAQKAVDFYWPGRSDRPIMTKVMKEAAACYFVSKHNLILTEEQFGTRLKNGYVIFNPLKIGSKLPYPAIDKGYKLACVGRLFVLDKGQDILLRILNQEKWRERPITITFVGSGVDDEGLKDMAALLDIKNVSFAGQVKDMDTLWTQYHALVLPSRSEGLPLSMVEAMAAGRIAIVSNAGGNTELIEEGVTAFSGHPNEQAFEEAMDRAWAQREQWEELGSIAASQISKLVPASPEADFVKSFLQILNGSK